MNELQLWVKNWLEVIGVGVGLLVAFLVPYLGWRKDAMLYKAQKESASSHVGRQVANGITQAFVIDNAFVEKIGGALDRHTAGMDRLGDNIKSLCHEAADMKRTNEDLEHQIRRLRDTLVDKDGE